jgi:histidinol-phosphate aminotransferase
MKNIDSLIREDIRGLKGYHVEDIPCRVKLDANENPYPIPDDLWKMVIEKIEKTPINRYPDPDATELRGIIAEEIGIVPEEIIIGNGSDELIQMIITTFCGLEEKIFYPVPSFSMYKIIAMTLGRDTVEVMLDDRWDLPLEEIKDRIMDGDIKIIFIGYPNNPTGNCFSRERILRIIEGFEGIVVLDEAYFDFSKKSFLSYLKEFNNLIILRSLSKIGMAGLRVGFLVADKVLIETIAKVKLPYNSNVLSQVVSRAILKHREFIDTQVDSIISERERLLRILSAMDGVKPCSSDANFILFKTHEEASIIYSRLIEKGVLIRNMDDNGRLKNYLRVTVGRSEENDAFLGGLKDSLER